MSDTPYFPPLHGKVDCIQCEISSQCWCRDKYQRDRRDFSHISGRCPRLPDMRGFVEANERELYRQTFPLVYAKRRDDGIHLTLTIPSEKRSKKVYHTRSGYWYFREKDDSGIYVKRVLRIESYNRLAEITWAMDLCQADYCVFRAKIEDYCV